MRRSFRSLVLVAFALGMLALPLSAGAGHKTDPRTKNIHPLGHIEEPASLLDPAVGNPDVHTDIAFWGKLAFQGNWDGFNIRNISAPGKPKQVSRTFCDGDQGDIVVWDDVLVRSWNSPTPSSGRFCDGEPVAPGWEGVHIFDISNKKNPVLVGAVEIECGSHTASGVPDLANDRLLVYNSASSAACPWFDIVEVPLDDPGSASIINRVDAMHTCHDIGVILGSVNKAACAGGAGFRVFDVSDRADPQLLYHVEEPGVTIGHSASWSWDGEVIVFGHEPGGGVQARCKENDSVVDRSIFFYDGSDGTKLGQWTLTRFQSRTENCTLHNYNVVPKSGKYVLVHGSYQSGTSVVDFTNPASPREIAWSDPPPLPVPPGSPFCRVDGDGCELGGVWSSYWYNGFIYETNITEGLNVFKFSGRQTAGAMKLGHLNPQTQEFSLP